MNALTLALSAELTKARLGEVEGVTILCHFECLFLLVMVCCFHITEGGCFVIIAGTF